MKNIVSAIALLAVVVLVSPVTAADPTGTWKSTTTVGAQSFESTLRLKLDSEGPHLSGASLGGAGGEIAPLASTSYRDGQISFVVRCEVSGQPLAIKYSGKLQGDKITGKSEVALEGKTHTSDWVATREKK